MRQRTGRSLGHQQDLIQNILALIRNLESAKTSCTKSILAKQLSTQCNISVDKADNALDLAIRQGRIIELFSANQTSEPLCHDVLRLKIRRNLRLSPNYDLSSIVRNVLLERGSRSSQDARSISEIHDHIMTTYNLQENSVEYLSSCLDKAIKLLLKRNQIETKVPLNDTETRYFLISPSISISNNLPATKPSTSTKDENSVTSSSPLKSPNHNYKTNRREKRVSQTSQNATADNSANKTELKALQDSLSAFFTPAFSRRSRVAQSSFSLEHLNDHGNQLENVINNGDVRPSKRLGRQHSGDSVSLSKHSTPSPNARNADKLYDSLSPYFSANNEQRRKHKKGEYLKMSNGGPSMPPKKKVRSSMQSEPNSLLASVERTNRHADFFEDESSDFDEKTLSLNESNDVHRKAAFDSAPAPSTSNESVAELEIARASSPPTSNRKSRTSLRASESAKKSSQSQPLNNRSERSTTLKSIRSRSGREKLAINRVSKNVLKRVRRQCHARAANINQTGVLGRKNSSVLPMTPKKSFNAEPASSTIVSNGTKASPLLISSPARRASFSPVKSLNLLSKIGDETPVKVLKADETLYQKTRMIVQKRMDENSKLMYEKGEEGIFPAKVRIGRFEINTWYSSPYPQEFACLPMLYVCERCLMYLCNDGSHQEKCKLKYPPGNEIYRNDNLSVFELDGNSARVYCRNLCLLAKLFIDHKTLYFDVEPFLFYVLTVNDEHGCHFVGYFSKEKYSHQQFNLACIVTLPCYQKKGYGRFLIDFSYLLSRRENMLGTPERPLSTMGKIAYDSYWRTAIFEFLHQRRKESALDTISAMDIAKSTGITAHDVVDVLKIQGFLAPSNGEIIGKHQNLMWSIDWDTVNKHWNTAKKSDRRIWLNESKLNWAPKIYTPNTDFFLRSPLRSPVLSPGISPRKISNFKSATQPFRRTDHSPKKAETSRYRIPIERKSPKKLQHSASNSKNVHAAVFTKNERDSGAQSDKQSSTKLAQQRKNAGKRQTSANLTRPSTEDEMSDAEDTTTTEVDRSQAQPAQPPFSLSTAASKTKHRKTYNSYSSCTSDSSNEDEDRTIIHRAYFHDSKRSSPAVLRGAIGKKKLPEEVERAQQRSEHEPTKEEVAARRPLQKMQSVSSVQSSEDEDSDFMKLPAARRSSTAKRKIAAKRQSSRSAKSTPDENIDSKNNPKTRATAKRSNSSRRFTAKKKSPSKQQKTQRTRSKSPTPCKQEEDDEESVGNIDENTDDEDRYRSSTSPPPLGNRQTRHSILHRASFNQVTETVNLGGSPQFVNLGGEPEDDEAQPTYANTQTPKAPKPHASLEDEEEHDVGRTTSQNNQHPLSNYVLSTNNHTDFNTQSGTMVQSNQQSWNLHKHSTESLPNNYHTYSSAINSFTEIGQNFQQPQTRMGFPTVNNSEQLSAPPIVQNTPHIKFMLETSPDRSAEMPILNPGPSEDMADDEMPTLNEEDADDNDAPPELSPMPNLTAETNAMENDEPDSFEPPKLEDSTAPVSSTPKATQSLQATSSILVPKAVSFDSFVDQKAASLRKKSMPASMLSSSADGFENDSFNSGTPLPIPQVQQRQSPTILHHAAYNTNTHPAQNQMFSPQAVAVHTPNSLQPQSHASNSTASESAINVSDIISPPNLQKQEHLPPPYNSVAAPPQQQQSYSPTKPSPLINAKSSTTSSRKDKPSSRSSATNAGLARRRNTTDGSTLKPTTPLEQQASLDPKFVQQPPNSAALNGMFLTNPHFMNPYLMPNPLQTANNQFNAIAQQSAPGYYDYTNQQAANYQTAAFYNGGGFYPPYQAPGEMLNPMPPNVNQFMSLYQIQQSQQPQIPPMLQPHQLPTFGQITNTAIASNPASLMNNGAAASLYYNGFT